MTAEGYDEGGVAANIISVSWEPERDAEPETHHRYQVYGSPGPRRLTACPPFPLPDFEPSGRWSVIQLVLARGNVELGAYPVCINLTP